MAGALARLGSFDRRQLAVVALAGLAAGLVSFDSAVLTLGLPAIANGFHVTASALSELGSAISLGSLLGLPLAMLADRLGRRRLLVASVAGFSTANLASAFAPSIGALAVARLGAVAGETVASAVATALVVEEVGPHQRGLAVSALTLAAGGGTGLTTLLYPLLAPDWRILYLLGAGGLLAVPLLAWCLPESRAWSDAVSPHGSIPLRLLWERPWRRRVVVVALAGALSALFYSPAGLLVALFGSRDLSLDPAEISAVIVVSGVASIPAFVIGGRLSDRMGRRGPGIAITALTALVAGASFRGGRVGYWTGNVLWSVGASAATPIMGAWGAELFPTRARATSQSLDAVAGSVGGLVGFQLVGALTAVLGLGWALAALALAALAGAGLLGLLPETRGQALVP
jgi:MFS family permease